MVEVDNITVPVPLQTNVGSMAAQHNGDRFQEFTGIASWMDRPWVFGIGVGLIALIYLCSLTPNWYPSSDSALYLMLGDNLASGQGYSLWGKPHVHVPPGFPLLLASLKRAGVESDFARNLVMMLLAWGTLIGCYFALRELTSTNLARWLILLVGTSHVMHHTSVCQLSDIPFMGVVWLGLWCQLRGMRTGSLSLEIGTCLLLVSCLLRIVGFPMALGAALGLLWHPTHLSRKRIWLNAGGSLLCVLFVLGFGVGFLFVHSDTQNLPGYLNCVSIYTAQLWETDFIRPFQNVFITASELSTLLTGQKNQAINFLILFIWIPVVIGASVCWKRQQKFGCCIFACYLLPLLLMRPLIARYLLPLSPFLFWYTLEGIRWLSEHTPRWQLREQRMIAACAVLLLVLNVPKAGKLAYRLHYPKVDNSYREQRSVAKVTTFLKTSGSSRNLFIANDDVRILSYLSGRWAVPHAEERLKYNRATPLMLEQIKWTTASHFVLRKRGHRKSYSRLYNLIREDPRTKLVFEFDDFKVFRIESALATSRNQHITQRIMAALDTIRFD